MAYNQEQHINRTCTVFTINFIFLYHLVFKFTYIALFNKCSTIALLQQKMQKSLRRTKFRKLGFEPPIFKIKTAAVSLGLGFSPVSARGWENKLGSESITENNL